MSEFDRLLLGKSPALRELINAAQIVAATDITTLICGESGTGKKLIARAIHLSSPRRTGPFVSINCASLPEKLAESLIFGHRKGSFTEAAADHVGHIHSAEQGTLFLDEVAELPLSTQAKFLRFLETGESLTIGEALPEKCHVRVIAATNRDLNREVSDGRFRADLFYRLNVVPLTLPPLRERQQDVELLLDHFVAESAERYRLAPPVFTKPALNILRKHAWPGNVRELRNLAKRMVVLFHGRAVDSENLPRDLLGQSRASLQTAGGFVLPAQGILLDELEADMMRQALHRTDGNRSRAARLLGLTRDTFLYRLKKYAIA